jgi:hypothetical protein
MKYLSNHTQIKINNIDRCTLDNFKAFLKQKIKALWANAHKVPAKTFLPKRSHRNVPENKVPEKGSWQQSSCTKRFLETYLYAASNNNN